MNKVNKTFQSKMQREEELGDSKRRERFRVRVRVHHYMHLTPVKSLDPYVPPPSTVRSGSEDFQTLMEWLQ